jgi:hypothetical protein
MNNFFPVANLDARHTMNRRDPMKSPPMLAAFGSASRTCRRNLSRHRPLRTAICAYSFHEALKKTMTYDDSFVWP